jgi:hypothetical protein
MAAYMHYLPRPKPKLLRTGLTAEDEYDTERDMTWSELFFDLIFVVAIARLGEHLREPEESGITFPYVGIGSGSGSGSGSECRVRDGAC